MDKLHDQRVICRQTDPGPEWPSSIRSIANRTCMRTSNSGSSLRPCRAGKALSSPVSYRNRVARQRTSLLGSSRDLFVAIVGKHAPQWFELDCGNTGPVLVTPHAWGELGLPVAASPAAVRAELDVRGLGKVACDLAAKEMIYDGVLNAAFCERLVLTLDLRTGCAWARPK